MTCLRDMTVSKSRDLDKKEQLDYDVMVGQILWEVNLFEKIRQWVMAPNRLELHVAFESIP